MPSVVYVDAFTDRPFSGNPAAVCVLDAPGESEWMQALATELNLPATSFVWRQGSDFGLRWFTSVAELSLCGHGTLASAHVRLERVDVAAGATICFQTAAGRLSARHVGAGIELDFPAEPSTAVDAPPELIRAFRQAVPLTVERNRLDYLVELASEEVVQGLIVTARATGDGDFVSRFFAPRLSLDEDHVTGSAHCGLGPYWQRPPRPRRARRTTDLTSRRSRPRRGTWGSRSSPGRAVTVARGELSSAVIGTSAVPDS